MSLLSGARLVAVDTETTGFDALGGDVLLEVACVPITVPRDDPASGSESRAELGDTWSRLVRPRRPIPADAVRVHGITEAMVADAPEPPAVAAGLRDACGDRPLVFHNAGFDLPFLAALLRSAAQPPLTNPVIDTLGLARGILAVSEHSLGGLAQVLGLPAETLHRAAGDARTTARLFLVLAGRWERERGVRTLAELAAVSQDVVRLTRRARREGALEPVQNAR